MEHDIDSDSSLPDVEDNRGDDEDIAFAESAAKRGRSGRNRIRPSIAQAAALGLTPEGTSVDVEGMGSDYDPSYVPWTQNQQAQASAKAARLLRFGRGHA
jgi:hypothetical protein